MAEQEQKSNWGISPYVIDADFEVELLDSENLRELVEEWSPKTGDNFKEAAEIVHRYPAERVEVALQETIRQHPNWNHQGTIDGISLKPETLERVYKAIMEVEQREQGK